LQQQPAGWPARRASRAEHSGPDPARTACETFNNILVLTSMLLRIYVYILTNMVKQATVPQGACVPPRRGEAPGAPGNRETPAPGARHWYGGQLIAAQMCRFGTEGCYLAWLEEAGRVP